MQAHQYRALDSDAGSQHSLDTISVNLTDTENTGRSTERFPEIAPYVFSRYIVPVSGRLSFSSKHDVGRLTIDTKPVDRVILNELSDPCLKGCDDGRVLGVDVGKRKFVVPHPAIHPIGSRQSSLRTTHSKARLTIAPHWKRYYNRSNILGGTYRHPSKEY
jgi:hypothetical protein